MALINVYSRSPIGHAFTIIEGGVEKTHVIQGTNSHEVVGASWGMVPRITPMEETTFNKIKETYLKMGHVKFFGGKDHVGVKHDPLIYLAKDEADASKMMSDAKPIITDNEMATKTKGVEETK